uniref:Uncharacterized protein n=1 Tax=Globodera pallida TaxID=36090 RepID=A0A183C0G8_GLOPA
MVAKLLVGNIFAYHEFATKFGSVYIYLNTVRMLLIYLLLAERTLATVLFRRYFELNGRLWLNIGCVIVLSSLSYAIQVTQKSSPHDFDDTTMISIILLFALQIFAIMIFMFIYLQNKAKYKGDTVLTLNQRFQLSENIRTLKQLGPTFVLYTLTVVLIYGIKFLFIFGWVVNDVPTKIAFMLQTLLLSCVNIGIELTVITHHPMLKRKAIQCILNSFKLCRKFRVGDAQSLPIIKPKDLFGEELIIRSPTEDYFNILAKAWS